MAGRQEASAFNEIIQAGRQKKRNEELANKLLGKNRRSSAPGSGIGNKAQNATPGSLASRIGVTKRSSSVNLSAGKNSRSSSATRRATAPNAKPTHKRRPDEERLMSALNPASGQATTRNNIGGINIKGAGSGPFVVTGSNFAPGTTAADIQSAVEPVSGRILTCWITSQHPVVTAEITFVEKSSAEKAVANFHNQRADGRVISMRLTSPGIGHNANRDVFENSSSSFSSQREQVDHERRSNRNADPTVQDGRYGFSEQNNRPLDSREATRGNGRNSRRGPRGNRNFARGDRNSNQGSKETGLYSDQMMTDAPTQNPKNQGRR